MQDIPPEIQGNVPSFPDGLGSNYDLWRVDLGVEYDLPNNHTFTTQLARGESGSFALADSNHGLPRPGDDPDAGIRLGAIVRGTVESNFETRVTSGDDNRLRYMLGVNYYELENYQGFVAGAWFVLKETRENLGVFGSLEYDINEQFTLSLEGRWADDELTVDFSGITGSDPYAIENRAQKYSEFMPRVILSYQPTEQLNLYANWSKSYNQGQNSEAARYLELTGIDLGVGTFTPTQELDAYEIGIKHAPADWWSYALAAFYYDWANQTFGDVVFTSIGFVSAQVPGSSDVTGFEFETNMSPTNWFELTAGFSYNDVKFTDYAAAGSVATAVLSVGASPGRQIGELFSSNGKRTRYVPKYTGSFTGRIAIDELVGMNRAAWVQLTGTVTGDFFVDNHNWGRVAGYWKFNARAGMDINENVSVELYGRNLTNDLSYGNFGGTTTSFGTPNADRRSFGPIAERREIGIRFSYEF